MTQQYFKKIPALILQSPWLALCFALLFSSGVLIFELRILKSESTFARTLIAEKGQAFITILENALRTEPGLHLEDSTLHTLIKGLGTDNDLYFLALVDAEGKVLLGTDNLPEDMRLWEFPPSPELSATEVLLGGEQHFRISRRMQTEGYAAYIDNQHRGIHENPQFTETNASLWAVADYNTKPIRHASDADRLHLFIIALVLLCLAFLGVVSWYFVRRHLRSKQIMQEATAFSSHILRNLPIGIIATNTEYDITSMNAEAARIINIPRMAPESCAQAKAPRLPSAWEPLMASLQSGVPVREVEMRCSFNDERPLPLCVSASSLATETGQQLGFVFIVRDLGEIRHLQTELRRRDRLAALGTLAAGIAHEVRNPLSAIRGIACYFGECHAAESEAGALSFVLEQEVLRLDKVVSNLLDLARPDILHCEAIALDMLVERARRVAEPALVEHKVAFELKLPSPPPTVFVDGDRLKQVLINLFLNAVDAMHQSPQRKLSVLGQIDKGEGESWLALEVEDTGSGIAPERMQDIFSPYYTTKTRGTGLGLAIVHKIVEAHEGSIVARNSRHGGCIMALRIPLKNALPPSLKHKAD